MLVQTPEGQTPGKAHSSRSGADSSCHLGAGEGSLHLVRQDPPRPLAALSEREGLCPGPWKGSLGCGLLGQSQHPSPRMLLGNSTISFPLVSDSPFLLSSPLNLRIMTVEALLGAKSIYRVF